MFYDPQNIEKVYHLTQEQKEMLEPYMNGAPLKSFLYVPRRTEEFGIDFIYSSAQIEGNTYTPLETADLIKLGITAGGKKHSDAVMILNMREAYDFILNGSYELGYNFLLDLHGILTDKLLEKRYCGVVRDFEVKIGGSNYIPPNNPISLVEEMKYMLPLSEKIEHPIDRAIYVHLNICYLQYFADGNKRTARNYQNAVLLKTGLMPLLFDEQDSKTYSKAVVAYYETGNSEPYVEWFLNAYLKMHERLKPQQQPEIPKRISPDFNTKD